MQLQDMINKNPHMVQNDNQQIYLQSAIHKHSSVKQRFTVVIPVRIDCEERKANLRTVLSLLSVLDCRILVLEADSKAKLQNENWILGVEYLFIKDDSPVFYRTRYINMLLHMTDTDIVSIWDTDVLISLEQLFEAISMIEQGCTIAYPYNGDFVMLTNIESDMARQRFDVEYLKGKKMQSLFGRKSCGGIFLVHRRRYLNCGGENEHFTGWGPEDAERLRRVSILGHKVSWTNVGQAYHLYHPRGSNSNYFSNDEAIKLRKEFCCICGMDREELRQYIKTWQCKSSNQIRIR